MKRSIPYIVHVPVIMVNLQLIQSFQPNLSVLQVVRKNKIHHSSQGQILSIQRNRNLNKRFSKNKDEVEENDDRTGMSDAFKSLDALSSLDLSDVEKDPRGVKSTSTDIKADQQLLKDVKSELLSDQDEVKLYTGIVEEMEKEGEDGVYDNILEEMKDSSSTTTNKVLMDVDGIGSSGETDEILTVSEISQDTDKFMKRALEEAMDEVKEGNANVPKGILDDAEMMKEINDIFDRANEKILNSVAEIKAEQAALTEESAKARKDALKGEEQRLAEAEGSVSRLLDKVKEETLEVEKAMKDLQKAQEQLLDDPLMKAADLKSGGIVKTASLAGALLFSFRSIGELLLLTQGADHGIAAAIQAVIAVACAAYFLFA